MSTSKKEIKKEIIKAIYIKFANDELEFVTICSKSELQSKKDIIQLKYPNNEIVTKTFTSIDEEPETPKFYRFICEIVDGDFIARVLPCSKFSTFNVRHIPQEKSMFITISGKDEHDAFNRAHELFVVLYKKYCL